MVAQPKFLDELRKMVEKYRGKLRVVFLSEDFHDGDYTRDPSWVVDSGKFQITPSHRVRSQVTIERPVASGSPKKKSGPFGIILKELIRSTVEEGQGGEGAVKATKASIRTLTRIAPAFEVDLVMVSESQWGSMEVVLLGGDPPKAQ